MDGRPVRARLSTPSQAKPDGPLGEFVSLDGERHYRISAYHRMAPFLVSLASDSDLWMYVTSGGGLAAGRVDPDGSLFPYLTVDQLHDAHHHSGPATLIRSERAGAASALWEPFSETEDENPRIERHLYKNTTGNRIVFEEINLELGLAFRYCWSACDEFGWVRSSTLENREATPVRVALIDGLRNVLPFGAPLGLYQQASTLVDAYKKSELDPETGLGIFSLTAGITDRAEALEQLRANTVWCCGLGNRRIHLKREAIADFRHERNISGADVLNGARGNYLVTASLHLDAAETARWHLVADVGKDHVQIAKLRRELLGERDLDARIMESLRLSGENLRRIVGSADGIQRAGDLEVSTHHFANVLFNNMRGGVFTHNYDLPVADFADFLRTRNRVVAKRWQEAISELPSTVTASALMEVAESGGDPDFERLCLEYLPLYFGRRHGDPSRPWNRFSIRTRNESGGRALHYEGNWRDIFQNWEALCRSFPGFLPNVIAKFVNASTMDGYNPYRISREGVDWEISAPDEPWNNIGYWGDHQIVYLLKLLESLSKHDPSWLAEMLGREIFSYAEVPYIIKPYKEILEDPSDTIEFDMARAEDIDERVEALGSDGRLMRGRDGSVYLVNLLEKLLVTGLAKISNLIPDAGIWMNTQRPEWNDANNALGGGGVSVVTLCYLRRYLRFLTGIFQKMPATSLPVSVEIGEWFGRIRTILERERSSLDGTRLDARDRKRLLDGLGEAYSDYRAQVYAKGFSGKAELSIATVSEFFESALAYIEWGIRACKRDDGLYHSYNLLDFSPDGSAVEVVHLYEMLEGQVAILSSGIPDSREALRILEQMFASDLYRPDQNSFLLYPARVLPGFLDKNKIAEERARSIPLIASLLDADDRSLIALDADGVCRFHGSFRDARDLEKALDALAECDAWYAQVARDRADVLALFEEVFRHKSYTGRSGVMYGYEGLGCIYWHMVAKLQLAVQEIVLKPEGGDESAGVREELAAMYSRIRAGFGHKKSVVEYGAFPTDPYSHTAPGGGAKQPGMTGHVKEAILARIGELGVHVADGRLRFQPQLLQPCDWLEQPAEFRYFDVAGRSEAFPLAAGSLAFTYCQVPVIYERVLKEASIRIELSDGSSQEEPGNELEANLSNELFSRSGLIRRIRVGVPS